MYRRLLISSHLFINKYMTNSIYSFVGATEIPLKSLLHRALQFLVPTAAKTPRRGDEGQAREGETGGGIESRRNPAESSAVLHIRGCAACQTRGPLRTDFTGGLRMGAPFVCKIRPPGARRRRATDIHVTLLPYRYQSRRHNTARQTTIHWRETKRNWSR